MYVHSHTASRRSRQFQIPFYFNLFPFHLWDFWNWTKHWRLCSREWPERLSCKSITGLWFFWCKVKIPVKVYSPLRSQVSKEADKVTGESFLVFRCNHRDRGNTKEVTYQGHSSWGRKSVLGWFLCSFGWVKLAYAFYMAFYFFFLFCITSLVDSVLVLLLWSLLSLTVFSVTT